MLLICNKNATLVISQSNNQLHNSLAGKKFNTYSIFTKKLTNNLIHYIVIVLLQNGHSGVQVTGECDYTYVNGLLSSSIAAAV